MEIATYIKNIKISPKKLRFLLPEIKKLKPAEALDCLLYTPKKGAKIFYKAIKSAIDNAKNVLKIREDLLRFKLLTVEEGGRLKRYRPGGRGTVKPIVRRMSHIKIILKAENKKEEDKRKTLNSKSKAESHKMKSKMTISGFHGKQVNSKKEKAKLPKAKPSK
ncbi:MAG: 50S ribosomal protein L22 [Microgenomates group bacterium]